MLNEIKEETPIDVRVFVAQIAGLPSEVKPGLSDPVRAAIPVMCERIMQEIESTHNQRRSP
jgi:Ni,Fe-hydrogenase maturation factor